MLEAVGWPLGVTKAVNQQKDQARIQAQSLLGMGVSKGPSQKVNVFALKCLRQVEWSLEP